MSISREVVVLPRDPLSGLPSKVLGEDGLDTDAVAPDADMIRLKELEELFKLHVSLAFSRRIREPGELGSMIDVQNDMSRILSGWRLMGFSFMSRLLGSRWTDLNRRPAVYETAAVRSP